MDDLFTLRLFSVLRLLFACSIFFFWLPRIVLPQDYIDNSMDRAMFNCIHMIAIITLAFPVFIFFRFFGFPFLILFFTALKLIVIKYWYKKSLRYYLVTEIYNGWIIFAMKAIEDCSLITSAYKLKIHNAWQSFKVAATPFNMFACMNIVLIVFYALYIRLLGPFSSLVAAVSDMYQYFYWNQILKLNKLYDVIAGAPYPWGSPVLIYTVNLIAKLNTVVLYNTFPLAIICFSLFTFYYFIKKLLDSKNEGTAAFLIAIIIFWIVIPSPAAQNFFGTIFLTRSPHVSHLSFLSIYSGTPTEHDTLLISYPFLFFLRYTTVLPYEVSSTLILPSLYFLLKSMITRRRIFFLMYTECLAIMSAIHPGVLIPLFLPSFLIVISVLFICGTDSKTIKTGIIAVSTALGVGSLWLVQMFVYGIPEDVGAAAPFLDALFKTKRALKDVAEASSLASVQIVSPEILFLILFACSAAMLLFCLFREQKEERAIYAAIPIFSLSVIFLYYAPNMGLPRFVDHSRLQTCLALSYALVSAQYYYLFLEKKVLSFIFRGRARLVSFSVIFILTIFVLALTPRWIDNKKYCENINLIELKETPYYIFQIEEKFQPFTYTIVSYVESFSQIMSLGFHINTHEMLTKYSPVDKVLNIPTEFVFIVVENIPVKYDGMGQFWYRWRDDIMIKTKDWIALYGRNHTNMKLWVQTDQIQIYLIDNRAETSSNRLKPARPILPGR